MKSAWLLNEGTGMNLSLSFPWSVSWSSLISKGAMAGSQLLATWLVLRFLGPVEQGYYFAFVALIAAQGIFELGLGQVLIVFLSHETGPLCSARLKDHRPNKRARAICSASLHNYIKLMLAYALAIGALGAAIFVATEHGADHVAWRMPWLFLILTSALRMPIIWLEAVIEGLGHIHHVLNTRILTQLAWLAGFYLCMLGTGDLLAIAVANLVFTLAALVLYFPYRHVVLRLIRRSAQSAKRIDWKREVRPMQRQVSKTWMASYLISSTTVPLCFVLLGPAESGRAGVAFQAAAAVGVVTGALIGPKLSIASRLLSENLLPDFRALLRHTMKRTILAGGLVAAGAFALFCLLPVCLPDLSQRLASPAWVWPLLLAAVINAAMSCTAVFSRAGKQEIFVRPLFVVAGISLAASLVANQLGGLFFITAMHGAAALFVTLPCLLLAYRRLLAPTRLATSSTLRTHRPMRFYGTANEN